MPLILKGVSILFIILALIFIITLQGLSIFYKFCDFLKELNLGVEAILFGIFTILMGIILSIDELDFDREV